MKASRYNEFDRLAWARLRADMPLPLTDADLDALRGITSAIDMEEVETIYLPLSRLLNLYVTATQQLYGATSEFLGHASDRVPYIIGLAGSVAVGKSTTARILQALLARWPNSPRVELLTTDGFLLSNEQLNARGLMKRKGFPESYDTALLIQVLSDIKAGKPYTEAPIYSHLRYDIVSGERQRITQPDILIVEGLNVLQSGRPGDSSRLFVSDFFDFSIYLDADIDVLLSWYTHRFLRLRDTAFVDPDSYFHRYASLSDEEATEMAQTIWGEINAVNLLENVLPTRERASLILYKGVRHRIERIGLRKL